MISFIDDVLKCVLSCDNLGKEIAVYQIAYRNRLRLETAKDLIEPLDEELKIAFLDMVDTFYRQYIYPQWQVLDIGLTDIGHLIWEMSRYDEIKYDATVLGDIWVEGVVHLLRTGLLAARKFIEDTREVSYKIQYTYRGSIQRVVSMSSNDVLCSILSNFARINTKKLRRFQLRKEAYDYISGFIIEETSEV